MEKRYDTFFFDLDGTITDSSLGITNSVMYALKKYGIVETDAANCTSLSVRRLRIPSQDSMDSPRTDLRGDRATTGVL